MADINNILDGLYDRFLLRDVGGKILPGALIVGALTAQVVSPRALISLSKDTSVWVWLSLYGLAWVVGFAVQGLGISIRAIRQFPAQQTEQTYLGRLREIRDHSSDYQRQQVERYTVVKEATGNGALSLSLSVVICAIGACPAIHSAMWDQLAPRARPLWFVFIACFVLALFLFLEHHRTVKQQWTYMEQIPRGAGLPANHALEPSAPTTT